MRDREGINLPLVPPEPFISSCVFFVVVDGAETYGKFIAHFKSQTFRLGIANMVGMGWDSSADDAWLLGDKAEMFFGANTPGLVKGEDINFDRGSSLGEDPRSTFWPPHWPALSSANPLIIAAQIRAARGLLD